MVSLRMLRERATANDGVPGRLTVGEMVGDVRWLHRSPELSGALFQVASQFNLLEMVHPGVTPEDGVTRYEDDPTQGPACAIAAGAATIYRNYFAPVLGEPGQTRDRQLDGLADMGRAFCAALGRPVRDLWTMRNGYALCTRDGLDAIRAHLAKIDDAGRDALREALCIGLNWDVEVTDGEEPHPGFVSQAFCSALPVAYSEVQSRHWVPFATLILESAYEATLWAAVLNARRGASNIVLLTRLGGGAFGNADSWIDGALRHALNRVRDFGLDVRLVRRDTDRAIPHFSLL